VHDAPEDRAGSARPWLQHRLTEAHHVAEIGEVVAEAVTDPGDVRIVDNLVRPIVRVQFNAD
jgi:hypothetical protein